MLNSAVILNVDDSEPARYAKNRILSRAGYVVIDAATGSECLELFKKNAPDLVLLDINLPDMNGIEVCQKIKSAPEGSSVIVLQISATATDAVHATTALDSGADAYLAEPVDPDVLVSTARALIRIRSTERSLAIANLRLEAVNQELLKSNESLEQFAAVASHDLQEPLRSVIIYLELLVRSADSRLTAEERKFAQTAVTGAQRLKALIHDLLQYAQIGKEPARPIRVDLNAIFSWAKENLQEAISESKACVTSETLPQVLGDEILLRHVVQNLIGNGIKYRRPEVIPSVHICAVPTDTEWVIQVEDNGIGIEQMYWHSIFLPFKRLHGSDVEGTGIGLAVCRRAMDAQGGRVWVESTPGKGSTFFFALPVVHDEGPGNQP